MKLLNILTFIFVYISLNLSIVCSQQVNTKKLESDLISASDEEKPAILNKLSLIYMETETKKATEYSLQAVEIARRTENNPQLAGALLNLGKIANIQGNLVNAIDYFYQAQQIYEETDDKFGIGITYTLLADTYELIADKELVELNLNLALIKFRQIKNNDLMSSIQNRLGNVWFERRIWDKSLEFYKEAYQNAQVTNNITQVFEALIGMGKTYPAKSDNKKGLETLNEALNLIIDKEIDGKDEKMIRIFSGMGDIHSGMGDSEMAIYYYQNALKTAKQTGNKLQLAKIYLNLGTIYKKKNIADKAIEFLTKSRELSWEINSTDINRDNLLQLSDLYFNNQDMQNAYSTLKQYTVLRDTTYKNEIAKRKNQIIIAKTLDERERVIEKEKFKRDFEKQYLVSRRYIVLLYTALLLVLLVIVIYFYSRKKLKKEIRKLLDDREEAIKNNEIEIEKRLKNRIKKLNEELLFRKQVEVNLLVAKQNVEEKDKLKSAFMANMCHQLRTPLTAILGFAEILKNPSYPVEKREKYIDYINISGKILLNLTNDLSDISKIDIEQFEINKGEYFINRSMQNLFEVFKQEKDMMGLSNVEIKFSPAIISEDFAIETDGPRVEQVISNLLKNALKFTRQGNIEFGYIFAENSFLEFYVKDSGAGMDQEKLKSIFDRFHKIHNNQYKLYDGAGLGLPISLNIIKMLGGDLRVESAPNEGAAFYFTIPYIPSVSTPETVRPVEVGYDYNWNDKVILIAEDIDSNFNLFQEMLARTNITIIRAKNGKEAFDQIKRNKGIVLVLMDLMMPEMDGYEAVKLIKEFNKKLPVIAVTALAFGNEKERSLKAGCDDHITKPIKEKILLNKLNKYLDSKMNLLF
jgi:signal transduction histidine kinase/CheY-like chemotaxis protein